MNNKLTELCLSTGTSCNFQSWFSCNCRGFGFLQRSGLEKCRFAFKPGVALSFWKGKGIFFNCNQKNSGLQQTSPIWVVVWSCPIQKEVLVFFFPPELHGWFDIFCFFSITLNTFLNRLLVVLRAEESQEKFVVRAGHSRSWGHKQLKTMDTSSSRPVHQTVTAF